MIKKIVLVVLAVGSAFLCGCDNSKRIDKAILIDCIVVTKNDYTFVCISDEEIGFSEYNDEIIRYLVSSITVTEDMKIVIAIKGGVKITEPIYA